MSTLAELQSIFTLNGTSRGQWKLDLHVPGDWNLAALQQAADAARDHWADSVTGFKLVFPNTVAYERAEARAYDLVANPDPSPDPGDPLVVREYTLGPVISSGGPFPGGVIQPAASPQVAEVVTFRTGLPGRRRRGRCYLPPTTEADIDASGRMTNSFRDAMLAAFTTWRDEVVAAVSGFVCQHVVVTQQLPVGGQHHADVISLSMGTRVDTQRRRLPTELL